MPEIDDLTVRIDADRSPLRAALSQTERDVGAFAGRLERVVARSAGRIAAELESSLAAVTRETEAQAGAWREAGAAAAVLPGDLRVVKDELGEIGDLGEGVGRSLSGAFRDLVAGGRSLDEVLKQLEGDLLRLLETAVFGQPGGLGAGLGGLLTSATGLLAGLFHQGGVVGRAAVPGRAVPAALFHGAPRMQRGGIAGLKPGEVPAILHAGEIVLPRGTRARPETRRENRTQNTFNVTVNFRQGGGGVAGGPGGGPQLSQGQIKSLMVDAMVEAMRRNR